MSKPRRKPPTLTEQVAALLLTLVHEVDGRLVPCIGREEAKGMSAKQIRARFECDHGVFVTWGGTNHPTNLTFRLKAEHREKTRRDVKAIAKVRRGLRKRQSDAVFLPGATGDWQRETARTMAATRKPKARMQYTAYKDTHKRDFRTGKAVPRV